MKQGSPLWEYIHDEHLELLLINFLNWVSIIFALSCLGYFPMQISETSLDIYFSHVVWGEIYVVENLVQFSRLISFFWLVMKFWIKVLNTSL